MAVIQFSTLIPEREQIDFGEGKVFAMLSRYEMSPEQVSHLQNLRREMQMAQTQMSKAKTDAETLSASKKVDHKLAEIVKFIFADMPEAVLGDLGMGSKTLLIQYWGDKNSPKAEAPNATSQTSPN